jgi:AraC-like DNA-binding protein
MTPGGPDPVERDSRGILDPWLLRQRVQLTRYRAGTELEAWIDWFWAVRWDLPAGVVHEQQVLTHPGANFTVGAPDARAGRSPASRSEARLYGVARGLTTRVLAGQGWSVAALARPGGLGAFVAGPAAELTDQVVALGSAIAADEAGLVGQIDAEPNEAARVAILAGALRRAVRPERAEAARQVTEVARMAEVDRSLARLGQLCDRAGIGPRTLQRLFMDHAGVSPTWVLRRYRLLDAAESVRLAQKVVWADVARELGYADQAHLIRDFRGATGQTPEAYARAQVRTTPEG